MGQVAFDTQEFVETLENAGLPKDQAKAISLVVRKSHEVADLATKRDLEDLRKDIEHRFEKVEAQILDVRKDMENRFDKLGLQLTVRLGGMLILAVGALTAILKLVH
ncbi:DUF1640 domain-containing protein [Arsenophonus endosymbiont of Aphis craccivora]|uniref:DUF1640 domain-containing protein n=1 Tax=Arsenophonus endosymbiont of Aphis craccivora TaxID=1231049 RepID=UPI0015DC73CD|nr:DUF1640 domain-containing protein [Arsenophonus endosymbiont of Aphis craccivora]QLK87358.1 DUF1640 domain-containing protein [Arsenophonus endosymbiont of Aphis craccivora]